MIDTQEIEKETHPPVVRVRGWNRTVEEAHFEHARDPSCGRSMYGRS
jgi:hypothetical protein